MNREDPFKLVDFALLIGFKLGMTGYKRKRKLSRERTKATINIPMIISAKGNMSSR
jgi:hypothetical protein